jgi:hypothetical protein
MHTGARSGGGRWGPALLTLGLLLILAAAVLLLAREAPARLGGFPGIGRGLLHRLIPARPFPPERRAEQPPEPASAAPSSKPERPQ